MTPEKPNNRLTPPDDRVKNRLKNPNNRLKPPENTDISFSSGIDDIKVLDRDGEHQAVQADPNVFQADLTPTFHAGAPTSMADDCLDDDFLAPKDKSTDQQKLSPPGDNGDNRSMFLTKVPEKDLHGTLPENASSLSPLSPDTPDSPDDPVSPVSPEDDIWDIRYIHKPTYVILEPVAVVAGRKSKGLFDD